MNKLIFCIVTRPLSLQKILHSMAELWNKLVVVVYRSWLETLFTCYTLYLQNIYRNYDWDAKALILNLKHQPQEI